jgi:uncharacterized delta-60 repeat protein
LADTAAIVRYLADGSVDTSFSGDGLVAAPTPGVGFDGKPEAARMLEVQADGAILVGGTNGVGRWLSNGSIDSGFGTSGFVSVDTFFSLDDADDALALAPDGKVLFGGRDLRRLNADGSLDGSFGSGIVDFVYSGGNPEVRSVSVQPDGKVVVGLRHAAAVTTLRIARVLPSGSLDPMFGRSGTAALLSHASAYSGPNHVAVRSDGLVVATTTTMLTAFFGGECGNGAVEHGEDCDDGNVADGDGCDAHCCVADADGDGRCDPIDPCPLGVPVTKATLTFSPDSLKFSAVLEAVLPFPFAPPLDPITHGVRVAIEGGGDSGSISFAATGGAYDPVTLSGWSALTSGTKWKWIDNARGVNFFNAAFPGNVFKVTVQDKSSRTPGLVRIAARGRTNNRGAGETYPALRRDLPLRLGIMLDAHVAASAQCAEIEFSGSPPDAPYCTIVLRSDKTVCKTP